MEGLPDQDYYNQTTIHTLALVVILVASVLIMAARRRDVLVVLFVVACFIPPAQRIVVLDMDFTILRLMVLAGMTRIMVRREYQEVTLKRIDKIVFAWAVTGALVYTLRDGRFQGLLYSLGVAFDAVGMYFVVRLMIRDWSDWESFLKSAAFVAIPVAILFTVEKATQRNLFSVFGGVPEITKMREGRLRVQGAFAHPILGGVFWASLVPAFLGAAFTPGRRKAVYLGGAFLSLVMVFDSASSTPVMAVLFGIVAAGFFRIRTHMSLVRWLIVATVVGLHLVMNHPVWHLLARVNIVSGSTGYHRYILVDAFIRRFTEWAPLGVNFTWHWGDGLYDVTNQFVLEGVKGGLLRFSLFIWIIALSFSGVGRMVQSTKDTRWQWAAWSLGVSLFIHCSSFISVSYFGQIILLWHMTIAVIASLSGPDPGTAPSYVQQGATPARARVGGGQVVQG